MTVFSKVSHAGTRAGGSPVKKGLNLRLVIFFTVLTLVLTTVVIVAWEQLLRPPYYAWVARNYPGSENAENRYKIEQRGEHFFISMTVDVIVVSILLVLVNREHRRLVEAHERLAHSEKIATLGRVAAQVAHEVRNPLSGLLLYSLHLKSKVAGDVADGEVELIDKIIDTINHLTSTTEQILNFARPVKLTPQWVDLTKVTADVIQLLKSQITANGIETKLDLCTSNLTGMLDEASISAALLNLVLNAVQAMPDGGRLTITAGADGGALWLVVSDTGSGITQEQVKHIFEPFNTTKSRGLGLGMPYAQKIIEQHGGRISVESQLGEGTQVRIELPRGEERRK
jgi:two-component system sensor histidine kinase HydH